MNVSQIHDGDGEPVEMKMEPEKEAANRGGLLRTTGVNPVGENQSSQQGPTRARRIANLAVVAAAVS